MQTTINALQDQCGEVLVTEQRIGSMPLSQMGGVSSTSLSTLLQPLVLRSQPHVHRCSHDFIPLRASK